MGRGVLLAGALGVVGVCLQGCADARGREPGESVPSTGGDGAMGAATGGAVGGDGDGDGGGDGGGGANEGGCPPALFENFRPARFHYDDLATLCAHVAPFIECPRDRTQGLRSVLDVCSAGGRQSLRRACGVDLLYTEQDGRGFQWLFDSASGALLGARVFGPGLCGEGSYTAGDTEAPCDEPQQYCKLCVSGPERDASCPEEVLTVIPSQTCELPDPAPGCECAGGFFEGLPPNGGECGDSAPCPGCGVGTCWAECTCTVDGHRRWFVGCTE